MQYVSLKTFCFKEKKIFLKPESNSVIYFLFFRERRFMKDARIFILLKIPLTGLCYTPMVQSKPSFSRYNFFYDCCNMLIISFTCSQASCAEIAAGEQ